MACGDFEQDLRVFKNPRIESFAGLIKIYSIISPKETEFFYTFLEAFIILD
jgi:hypothetical protein